SGASLEIVEVKNPAQIKAPALVLGSLAAKLVWDVSQDWKKLLKEYCEKSFGAAAPMLESYYLRLADIQSRSGQEAGSYYAAPLIFDAAYLQEAQVDVDKALAQNLSKEQRERVEVAVFPLATLKQYLAWNAALAKANYPTAQKEYDAILADWQKMLGKNAQFVAGEVPGYMKGLMAATTSEGLKYSSDSHDFYRSGVCW
ncbi:MAG: hypothetical protein ACK5LK_07935, partial [Chthoniobacterales bacterium]